MLESVRIAVDNEPEARTVLLPLEGAAHFKPVASALSATILQEQSQRIMLSPEVSVPPQRSAQGDLGSLGVGLLW